jgi:hypothetical protein
MNSNRDGEPREEIAGAGEPSALKTFPLQAREDLVLPGTNSVIQGFNRNTMCVAMGLLGTVICAALVLAIQEHRPRSAEVAEKAMQKSGGVSPNDSPAALPEVVGSSGKIAGEISSERAASVEEQFTPEVNQADIQANSTSRSSLQRHDPARVVRPKTPTVSRRSSIRPRFVDVEMRLRALWHQSLARIKRSASWFSNLNKEGRKRVSYAAETTH